MADTTQSPQSSWLGPFLCKPAPDSMGFWLSLDSAVTSVSAMLRGPNGEELLPCALVPVVGADAYGIWLGETKGISLLRPDTTYTYSVLVDTKPYVPEGLAPEDLRFTTFPNANDQSASLDFVLMSCHGVEDHEKEHPGEDSAWRMWERLAAALPNYPNCRLGIMGGDQVYMDEAFDGVIRRESKVIENVTPQAIRAVYLRYWGNKAYRKVLARLPFFLMWDDHDLIDGFGSRPDSYTRSGKRKPHWEEYGRRLTDAFSRMQASRTPAPLAEADGAFTFSFRWRDLAFLALDLRSHRDTKAKGNEGQLLTQSHRRAIEKELEAISRTAKTLFLVSPVTIARMGGNVESALGGIANYLWAKTRGVSYERSVWRPLVWLAYAALFVFVSQAWTPNRPALVQAAVLGVLSFLVLCGEFFKKVHYLPQGWRRWVRLGAAGALLIALCVGAIASCLAPPSETGGIVDALSRGIERTWRTFWPTLRWMLGFGAVSLVTAYAFHELSRVKFLASRKALRMALLFTSGFPAFATALLFFWTGLPERSLTWHSLYSIPLAALMALLGALCCGIAFLEAFGVIDELAGLDDDLKDAWSLVPHVLPANASLRGETNEQYQGGKPPGRRAGMRRLQHLLR